MFKKRAKSKSGKTVEVELNIPKVSVTSFSTMSVVLVLLLSLIGYSGYLGVKSIWDFTHPKFNISLETFKALGYIASGQSIPSIISRGKRSNGISEIRIYKCSDSVQVRIPGKVSEFKARPAT